ncbi:T9SS type A sorting domain-containing protein [Flavobacterium lipolyticum]|uniref:T9SS type A sorting domain-containing protein n=1 Tax=Flavobacterium lipolyticum TaxID=2893754 RepID=A0ABS8LWB9_9FLAO|nr:T9SS type A sorting domain-containing protein [Flavobacterium sp. F-126]MCC9016867.1 T9SS type A sorting domain-containing protein [Flavobacterium sp. F-126]
MKKILLLALLSAYGLNAQTASDYVTGLPDVSGLAFDSTGNLYIGDAANKIIKVTPSQVQSTFATTNGYVGQLAFDANDNLWAVEVDKADKLNQKVTKIPPSGAATSYTASGSAYGIATDAAGNLFYSEQNFGVNTGEIKKISTTGTISTFFLDPNSLDFTSGMIFDKTGNLIVTDYSDTPLKKINPAGVITKISTSLPPKTTNKKFLSLASNGDLYIAFNQKIFRLAADDATGTLNLVYDFGLRCTLYGMTIYNGNLYVSVYDDYTPLDQKGKVIKITPQTLRIDTINKPTTEDIIIYPNPASDYLHVESKNELIKTIELYDLTGRLIKNYNPSEIKDNTIALSALTSGNYILKINNTSKKITIN